MLLTMAILAFKIIRNPLIYAVFVYRSDIFFVALYFATYISK